MHFRRSFCGKRYETRIFNFFGFCNEEVVTFIDSIAGQVKCQLKLILQGEMQQAVPSAGCVSSNNNNNLNNNNNEDQVKYFLCSRNNVIILYMQ